ncbi:hypothetical protein D3C76_1627690 [compost metagenome]
MLNPVSFIMFNPGAEVSVKNGALFVVSGNDRSSVVTYELYIFMADELRNLSLTQYVSEKDCKNWILIGFFPGTT